MRLLGFAGPAGSGKSTAAHALYQTDPSAYTVASFADPIRAMLHVGLGIHVGASGKATTRRLMQTLGTEWGRDTVDVDLWVNEFVRRHQTERRIILIDDVRFENEAALVRRHGALIHVMPRLARTDTHASEQGVLMRPTDWSITDSNPAATAAIVRNTWK